MEARITVSPSPPRIGEAMVDVELEDPAGSPIRGATLHMEGNMAHPGMRPSLAEAREVAPGHYQAPLQLTMGGDWFIVVSGELVGGDRIERTLPLPGVQP